MADATIFYDSDRDSFGAWKFFSRDGPSAARVLTKPLDASGPTTIELSAIKDTPMGLNMRIPALKGRISFEYKVINWSYGKSQFAVFAIPMQGRLDSSAPPLEVGARQPGKQSPLRQGAVLALPQAATDSWRTVRFDFDFTALSETGYVIVAPRINEATPGSIGAASFQMRSIRIYGRY